MVISEKQQISRELACQQTGCICLSHGRFMVEEGREETRKFS